MGNIMELQKKMRFKFATNLFIAICLAYVAYGIYGQMHRSVIFGDNKLVDSVISATPIAEKNSVSTTITKSGPANTISAEKSKLFTATEITEFKRWDEDHGYFPEQDEATYKSYSDSVLDDLAKKGDATALQVLGSRFVHEGDIKKAQLYFWDAAAIGSTTALDHLAGLAEPLPTPGETKEMRKVLVRQSTLESLAIYKLAALRGDPRISAVGIRGVETIYRASGEGSLELSLQELQFVDQRSQDLYRDLQARRTELGLDSFNNSTPRMLTDFIVKP